MLRRGVHLLRRFHDWGLLLVDGGEGCVLGISRLNDHYGPCET